MRESKRESERFSLKIKFNVRVGNVFLSLIKDTQRVSKVYRKKPRRVELK